MTTTWVKVLKAVGDGFNFIESVDEMDDFCIGTINGINSYEQAKTYNEFLRDYSAELEGLRLQSKKDIESTINRWINKLKTNQNSGLEIQKVLQSTSYKTYQIISGTDQKTGDPILEKRYNPPCAHIKLIACRHYIDFLEGIIRLQKNFLKTLSLPIKKKIKGFRYTKSLEYLEACHKYLLEKSFIDSEYKVFKTAFSENTLNKINWVSSIAALRYFIIKITAVDKLNSTLKWIKTSNCFLHNERKITPIDLRDGAILRDRRVMEQLDSAVNLLFPLSH